MRRRDRPPSDVPPLPWHRRPIGYDIEPRGHGWIAFLVREGDSEAGYNIIPIAVSLTEKGARRRAERAVRRELDQYEHEHSTTRERVILFPPKGTR